MREGKKAVVAVRFALAAVIDAAERQVVVKKVNSAIIDAYAARRSLGLLAEGGDRPPHPRHRARRHGPAAPLPPDMRGAR